MKKTKFAIINVITILLILLGIVISNETIIITNIESQLTIDRIFFIILSSITLIAAFIYLLSIAKKVKIFNSYFFIIAFIYVAINSATLAITEIPITFISTDRFSVNHLLTYPVTYFEIYQSIFFNISTVIATYLLVIILPQIISYRSYLLGIYYLLISTLFILIAFSLITEWDIYVDLFVNHIYNEQSTTSIFSDPNVFGFYITFGILGTALVETIRHRWWNYLIIFFFTIVLLPTFCFSGYVVTTLFLLGFFGYDLYANWKKRTLFSFSVFVISIFLVFSFIVFAATCKSEFALIFRQQIIPRSLLHFELRQTHWRHATEILDGIHIIIGRGMFIANSLLAISLSVENRNFIAPNRFHNGFFDLLATGGLLLVTLYLVIYILLAVRIFKIIGFNKKFGTTALFIFISYLLYTIPEAKVLFKADAMGVLATLLVVTPLVINKTLYAKQFRRI
jgi:O-antigen ligase